MDLLAGLNPLQKEAVQAGRGPFLVHAGPGSGKTRVITHRIAYLVSRHSVPPGQILAVTFSRRAAAEMRKRLAALLQDTAGSLTVSTFHSLCLSILRNEGVPSLGTAFEVVDEEAQSRLIKECLNKTGSTWDTHDLRRIKAAISHAKCNLIDPDAVVPVAGARMDDTAAAVFRLYQRRLKELRALDFDDMLVLTSRLFKDDEMVLSRYQQRWNYILVDEFQDTSGLQYDIVHALCRKHRNIFVVGDPDQTIYSWRQADMRNLSRFKKDFPDARVISLEENYRSSGNIVAAANRLISYNTIRKEKKLFTAREMGERLAQCKLADEHEEARFIARELQRMARERSLKYSSFAVLYRINAQSRALEEAFSSAGLPYRLVGGTPFYKRREIMDMLAWLRVLRNPADDAALSRVIKCSGKGIGPQTLAALQERARAENRHLHYVLGKAASVGALPFTVRTQRALARFYALIEELRTSGRRISLPDLLNLIIEKAGYRELLEQDEDGDERWENVQELISVAAQFKHLAPAEALASLTDRMSGLAAAEEVGQEADAVTFTTLHGAKGTEFPAVFMVGVEEGLLPHSQALLEGGRLEEERRLCYVGITRAMDLVCLTYAEKRSGPGGENHRTASRFLRELPADCISFKDLTVKPGLPVIGQETQATAVAGLIMDLKVGDIIKHRKFGVGRITEITEDSHDFYITVLFAGSGYRKLSFRLAGLEKMPDC